MMATMTSPSTIPFTFGIYPGALLGAEDGPRRPNRPDDPAATVEALRELQGDTPRLLVRAFRAHAWTVPVDSPATPADPVALLGEGRLLDLVLTFREPTGRLDGWLADVRAAVATHGPRLASLQICEEPNMDLPVLDGGMPNVHRALVRGVIEAKEEARARGYDIAVGFNAVASPEPEDDAFWDRLREEIATDVDRFHAALDYVGVDVFPDVFGPVPDAELADWVTDTLTVFRNDRLPRAGISPHVPLRVCEHGWPTGPGRGERRQAEVLERVVRAVHGQREALTVEGYSLFALRDAHSSGDDLFDRFGLLHDDYWPKPAFATYRALVRELTEGGTGRTGGSP